MGIYYKLNTFAVISQKTTVCISKFQIPLYQQERRMDTIRNLSNIVKGKKAKRNQQLEHQKQLGMEIDDAEFEKEVEIDVDEIKIPPIDEKNSVVQIFTGECLL